MSNYDTPPNDQEGTFYARVDVKRSSPWPCYLVSLALVLVGVGALFAIPYLEKTLLPDALFVVPLLISPFVFYLGYLRAQVPKGYFVGASGLGIVREKGSQTIPWKNLRWSMKTVDAVDQTPIAVFNDQGLFDFQIPAEFENHNQLAEDIQAHIREVHPNAPRELTLGGNVRLGLIYIGAAFLAMGFVLYLVATFYSIRIDGQRLQSEGREGAGMVTRQILDPDGTSTRLEIEVSGDGGRTSARIITVGPAVWEAAEEGTQLPIVYLPEKPEVFHLQIPGESDSYPVPGILQRVVLPLLVAVVCFRMVLFGWAGIRKQVILWDEDQERFSLKTTAS